MARREPKIRMTLGRELASEPKAGGVIVAERDGYAWAFLRSGAISTPNNKQWVAATVKDDRYYAWTDIKTKWNILVAFEIEK